MVSPNIVEALDKQLAADLGRDGRLGLPHRYLTGDHDLPYMPKKARREFKLLAQTSISNWTPLISDTFAKSLFVDGYRSSNGADNAAPWAYWQANGLDARQTIAHRGALDYGTSYVLVLPGTDSPLIRPLDPLRSLALYSDEDDEYPEVAFRRIGTTSDKTILVEAYDADAVYYYAKADGATDWALTGVEEHGLGVVPFVRFRERLTGESTGIIRPIIPLQNRVNLAAFATQIAIQYASFRQRWATGLAIPEDENGNPIEPLEAAVDRLWVTPDHEARFGDFAQTELSGHHTAYDSAVRTLAAVSQISPNILTGDLVNLSAEALAQLQDTTQRKLTEYEMLFGEAWEQTLRLAARAAGDDLGASDLAAEIRWRDTETRALKDTVDSLGTLAEKLQVPVEALWEKIPGTTAQEVERWRALTPEDPLAALATEINRQTAATSAEVRAGLTD